MSTIAIDLPITRTITKSTKPPRPKPLITGEVLFAMGDIGPSELVRGEIVYLMATGHKHGFVELNVGSILRDFVKTHKLGRVVVGEVGIYTARQPDTVRAADVAFVSHERLAQVQSRSYLDVAPELVVEVLSPDDRWSEVKTKLAEYFVIGVQLIWVIDPQREAIFVYQTLHDVEILGLGDELTGGLVLPEFKVAVAEFFAD